MTFEEKQRVLSDHLARFRAWPYADLAMRCEGEQVLEIAEGISSDGCEYQIEIEVFWNDTPHGDVRVIGDICESPHRPLIPGIPLYVSDAIDCFIMSPQGQFIGE